MHFNHEFLQVLNDVMINDLRVEFLTGKFSLEIEKYFGQSFFHFSKHLLKFFHIYPLFSRCSSIA